MELIITLIIVYLIGVVLCLGRIYACLYEASMYYKTPFPYKSSLELLKEWDSVLVILSSWVGFMIGIKIYFEDEEKTFLKF